MLRSFSVLIILIFSMVILPLNSYSTQNHSHQYAQALVHDLNLAALNFQILIEEIRVLEPTAMTNEEHQHFVRTFLQTHGQELNKEMINKLEHLFTPEELRDLAMLFQDKRVKTFFFLYHQALLQSFIQERLNNERVMMNLAALKKAISSGQIKNLDYVKHDHYGQKLPTDTLIAVLKTMDNQCCEGAPLVTDYESSRQKRMNDFAMQMIDAQPSLAPFSLHLQALYYASKDSFYIYWSMQEQARLQEKDYIQILRLLEKSPTFSRFTNMILKDCYELANQKYKAQKYKDRFYQGQPKGDVITA
jgi:hypothetical protein